MINQIEIEKLAALCRINISESEKEKFASEISRILSYVEKLREVDVGGVELKSDEDGYLRQDAVLGLCGKDAAKLISQAPEIKDNLIKTKPVF